MDQLAAALPKAYVFGPFLLDLDRRVLEQSGAPAALNSRGFDILVALIRHRDRIVARSELMALVWPGVTVEEHNLSVQISALRRCLGDTGTVPNLIATIPGRGYRFVGTVCDPPFDPKPAIPSPGAEEQPGGSRRPSVIYAAVPGVAILLAIALALGRAWLAANPNLAPPGRISIVVLPFLNLVGDPSKDAIADTVADDVATELAHIPRAAVIARESADTYRGRSVRANRIGRDLHVSYLLEGSLSGSAGALAVNAQLIDTRTELHIWADRFELPANEDLATAEDQIVNRVASELKVELVSVVAARAPRGWPADPTAADLFYQATALLEREDSPAAWDREQRLLEAAIAKDPNFADAYSALGRVLVSKLVGSDDRDDVADHARAEQAIKAALALAPTSVAALNAKAILLAADANCTAAASIYKDAITLQANDVIAMGGLGNCGLADGQPAAALSWLQRAMQLDPLNPGKQWRYGQMATAALLLSRYQDCLQWLSDAGVTDLDVHTSYVSLGWPEFGALYLIAARELVGNHRSAMALYAKYARIFPRRSVWRMAAYFPRGMADGPGFAAFQAALHAAGMPIYADESVDDKVSTPSDDDGDFAPTPLDLPGGRRVTTQQVQQLRQTDPSILVADLSRGAAVMRGAIWQSQQSAQQDPIAAMQAAVAARVGPATNRVVLVVGCGVYGLRAYKFAERLISLGYRKVLWYRGGDEAWSAQRQPSDDLRIE